MKKLFLIFSLLLPLLTEAQTSPVGMPVLEGFYRRAQLLGKVDAAVSFTVRPLFPAKAFEVQDKYDPDTTLSVNRTFNGIYTFGHKIKGKIQLLPVIWENQFNSFHPAGYNDGIMVPAKGYQTYISVGVYAKYGPLSIQFWPQMLYVENKPFDGFYEIYHKRSPPKDIDLPERFGDAAFNKFFWGQSSIRLTFGPISFGLSNENLWWGPGIHNALLMTNNAPGFKHLTLNTVRPIKTPIGAFEFQLIGGRLDGSGYTPSLPPDWRYLNAVVVSYHPRWVPGLFLGMTRAYQVYRKDMGTSLNAYLPVISPFQKDKWGNSETNSKRRDELLSLFMRWVWVKGHGEIYMEFGREDHAWNVRDFFLEPAHSAAYIVGMNKLFALKWRKGEFIQVNVEIANLASNSTTVNRDRNYTEPVGYWYSHSQVKQGYTEDGQVLGAGIGPGSNSQWIRVSWVKGLKTFGLEFERYVHNNDYFISKIRDIRRNWVDFHFGLVANWEFKHFLLNMQTQYIHEINYEWRYRPAPRINAKPTHWNPTKDTYNFHAKLGIVYRF
jgi:hypothetical protein